MYCASCGRENAPDARFCAACGARARDGPAGRRDAQGRHGRLHRRRRARRRSASGSIPESLRRVMWRLLRHRAGGARAARRHGREVHRRRGDGRLRRARRARGRRAARRSRGLRAARGARASQRRARARARRSDRHAHRRQHRRGDRRRRGRPTRSSRPATPSTSPRGWSRPPRPARCCSARETYARVRDAVVAETGAAGRGEGQERAARRRGGSLGLRPDVPAFARPIATPFVGRRRRARRAASGVRGRGTRAAPARSRRSSARPGSASRGSRARSSSSVEGEARVRRRTLRRVRRGHHVPPARRRRARRRGRRSAAAARPRCWRDVERGDVAARLIAGAVGAASGRRLAGRDRLGVPPPLRGARRASAARRRRRRHPLGRADAARPARVRRSASRATRRSCSSASPGPTSSTRARPGRRRRPRRDARLARSARRRATRKASSTACSDDRELPGAAATPDRRDRRGQPALRRADAGDARRRSRGRATSRCRRRSRRSSRRGSTGSSRTSARWSSAASVEGRLFHRGARRASCFTARDGAGLGGTLLALARKEFVRPDRSRFAGDDGFRFNHVLIRDVAYASMPKELRADLHARLARLARERRRRQLTGHDEIVGYHLEQAYRLPGGARPGRRRRRARSPPRPAACSASAGRRALDRGESAVRRVAARARRPAARSRARGARRRCSPTSAGRSGATGALDDADDGARGGDRGGEAARRRARRAPGGARARARRVHALRRPTRTSCAQSRGARSPSSRRTGSDADLADAWQLMGIAELAAARPRRRSSRRCSARARARHRLGRHTPPDRGLERGGWRDALRPDAGRRDAGLPRRGARVGPRARVSPLSRPTRCSAARTSTRDSGASTRRATASSARRRSAASSASPTGSGEAHMAGAVMEMLAGDPQAAERELRDGIRLAARDGRVALRRALPHADRARADRRRAGTRTRSPSSSSRARSIPARRVAERARAGARAPRRDGGGRRACPRAAAMR